MKALRGRILPTTGLLVLLSSVAYSQEFFREFGTSRTSSGIGRLSPASEVFQGNSVDGLSPITPVDDLADETNIESYNFKLGNLEFVLAAGFGVEFNDNITLANEDRTSDIIFRPEFDIEGLWNFSEKNKIRFGLGFSYAKYLDHSEFDSDSVLIAPTSAIVWSITNGSLKFTFRERLSYSEDPFDLPVVSNVANYKRWENQVGLQVDWDASEFTKFTVGFDHYNLWTKDDYFSSQDRAVDTVYFRPSFQFSPAFSAGINASLSWVDFKEDVQADALTMLIGPYILWKPNDTLDVYAEVGYQLSNFDGGTTEFFVDEDTGLPTGTTNVDDDDASSIYAKVELRHRPAERFRHKLVFSKTAEVGLGTNYYDLYHAEYTADWQMFEKTSLSGTLFYEYYETSGSVNEEADRFGAAVGIHHIYSTHLTFGLDYRFLQKSSNLPDADYYQNLALLSIFYKF